jgi:moderate conductance mechanosensitive channel
MNDRRLNYGMRLGILWVMTLLITLLFPFIHANAQFNMGLMDKSPRTTIGAQEIIAMTLVKLDGRTLFTIAGMNPSDSKDIAPLRSRAKFIEQSLHRLLQQGFDATSLRVEVHPQEDRAKIVVSDNNKLKDVPLFILTPLDARVAGFTLEESADYIANVTETALQEAWRERQPQYIQQQAMLAGSLVLGTIALSAIIWFLQRQLKKQQAALQGKQVACEQKITANTMAMEADEEDDMGTGYCHELATEQLQNRQRLNKQGLQSYLLQLAQGAIWLGVLALILGLFPMTRSWQQTILELPLLLGVLLLAIAAAKGIGILVDRTIERWLRYRQIVSPQTAERWLLRANSFAPIFKGTIAICLIGASIIFIISTLGIPLTPVLAGAGIIGFAISLGSQRLVSDLIGGALILIEDQYAIGDFVMLNDNAFGRVERLNLRSTALRNRQGNLITVSNSDIKLVNNLSKDWARAKLYIPVHYSADIDRAIEVITQVADEMKADSFWGPLIQEAEVRGVEDIDGYGFTIGLRFETKPGVFRKVVRECRRRLKPAFDRANIQFAERPNFQISPPSSKDNS